MSELLLLSIEIWDAFTTQAPSQNVLMSVKYNINSSLSKPIDQLLNLIKVSHVVSVRGSLDSLPHHA
jgi:hypothetical protein